MSTPKLDEMEARVEALEAALERVRDEHLRDSLAMAAPPMPEWWFQAWVEATMARLPRGAAPWKDLTSNDRVRAMVEWALEWADTMLEVRAEPAQSASDTAARLLLGEVLAALERDDFDRRPERIALVERIREALR